MPSISSHFLHQLKVKVKKFVSNLNVVGNVSNNLWIKLISFEDFHSLSWFRGCFKFLNAELKKNHFYFISIRDNVQSITRNVITYFGGVYFPKMFFIIFFMARVKVMAAVKIVETVCVCNPIENSHYLIYLFFTVKFKDSPWF